MIHYGKQILIHSLYLASSGDPAGTRTQNNPLGAIKYSCFNFSIAHFHNSYKHYSTHLAKLQPTFLTFAQ